MIEACDRQQRENHLIFFDETIKNIRDIVMLN